MKQRKSELSMKNLIAYKSLSLVLAALGWASAAYNVTLSTDKEVYLKYQPVYLGVHLDSSSELASISQIALEAEDVFLEITPPNGQVFRYRPSVTICRTGKNRESEGKSILHTLILSEGRIITEKPGTYVIQLFDAKNTRLSGARKFDVVDPVLPEDKEAVRIIERNPPQYGFFLYLEGGDHLVEALEITEKLSESNSSYSTLANSILAINYSQGFALGRDGRPRERDLKRFEKYLLDSFDEANDWQKARMLVAMGRQFGRERMSPSIKHKLQETKKQWSNRNDLRKNPMISEIFAY